eukprot:GHVP01059841.1.p1 GENE.GHVP01059841.1~~GHVP01059841.1.p1  ORF type:complete len:242 (+),score=31.14 GHVP01059841.1:104-829(+)
MAKDKKFGPNTLKAHGLEELVMETGVMIPEATEAVFAKAHQVRIDELTYDCHKIIHNYAAAAATTAGNPIPFCGAVTSPPIQAKMLTDIYNEFGVFLPALEITKFMESILGTNAMRSCAIGLLKFIPGMNVAASALSATSAFVATKALGHAVLDSVLAQQKGEGVGGITSEKAFVVLKKTLMSIGTEAGGALCESAEAGEPNDKTYKYVDEKGICYAKDGILRSLLFLSVVFCFFLFYFLQ